VVKAFGSYDDAALVDLPVPVPGPGEVLIEVRAAPINFVDLIVISGKYQMPPPLPFTPGKGPTGIVHAIGAGVTQFGLGDRVLAMAEAGGYAQFAVAPASQCYRLPDGLSFTQAGAMSLAFDTSWFALRDRARLVAGESVLVLGATGAVGLASVQLAKAMGARVLAAVSSPAKAALVREAGADAVIDLSVPDLREALRAQVLAANSGKGVDVIIDPLGGDVFDAAVRALAWRGRLVVIGFAAGRIPSLKMNYLLVKNIEITGLQVSDYRKRRPEQVTECYREVFDFYTQGKLKPLPVEELPLSRFAEGLRSVEERRARGRLRRLDQAVDLGRHAQIGRGDGHALGQGLAQLGQILQPGARQHHMGALSVQLHGDGAADAACGARHQGGLAGKIKHGAVLRGSWRRLRGLRVN
jgi:NADPH2:quinone reductase